jgi:L-lactate dehydrogenase complex protein LldE
LDYNESNLDAFKLSMTVDLFITCLNDALFPKTGQAVVRLLERLGHSVKFDSRQTCCGQMHFNAGYQREALGVIRHFVHVFKDAEVVVAPSGSCVAMVREMYPRAAEWAGDEELKRDSEALGKRCFELSEFLVDRLSVSDVGAYFPHRVVFHAACHSLRLLKVGEAPVTLLKNVGGIELVNLQTPDQCCGFGGAFSVKNSETSAAMLQDKVEDVLSTAAYACVAGDNSCLMHIGGGLSRQKSTVKTVHLAEVLASTVEEPYL